MVNKNQVGKVLVVTGTRGGVGVSTVSSLVALGEARYGLKAGVLDVDVRRPSVGGYFGVGPNGHHSTTPAVTPMGIKVMGADRLLPGSEKRGLWRGTEAAEVTRRLWNEVDWGKLDYLVVDVPSNADDTALAVMETLPVTGVILVFSPLETIEAVVEKARAITAGGAPVIALIENYRHLKMPASPKEMEITGIGDPSPEGLKKAHHPGQRYLPVFGTSRGDEVAQAADVRLLTRIPYDPVLARFSQDGQIERYSYGSLIYIADSLGGMLGDPRCGGCACSGGTCKAALAY
ncbi:MAG: P-loop NTPase [Chloroflexota bacterium]